MLQIIREKAQGVIAWTIVILIVITFTLVGVGDLFSSSNTRNYAAKVDKVVISWDAVNNLYNQIIREYANHSDFDYTKLDATQMKINLRDAMADNVALINAAEKYGFVATKQLIKEAIHDNPKFAENGVFSFAKYNQFLQYMATNEVVYQKELRQDILLNLMQNSIIMSAFSLTVEQTRLDNIIQQKRDFGYVIIPASKYEAQVKIIAADLEKYYEKNKELFVTDEAVSISYLKLSMDDLLKQISVPEAELFDYYQHNLASYSMPEQVHIRHILILAPKGSDIQKSGEAREKADDILAQLKTGANFSVLAKKFSQDYTSAKNGGDLGWVGLQDIDPIFAEAAFKLHKANQLSQVVQTDFGYHIIQLIARNEAKERSFLDVKNTLEAEYKRSKARDLLIEKFDELNQLAVEDQESLELVASKLGLDLKTTGLFTKTAFPDELNSKISQEAFSPELIHSGQNSEIIRFDDETEVIIRVDKHVMPHQQTFVEAKPEITKLFLQHGTKEMAKVNAEKFLASLTAGDTPFKLAGQNNLKWITNVGISRTGNSDLSAEITKKIFALPKPIAGKPVYALLALVNGDYAVVSLQKVTVPEAAGNINTKMAYEMGRYENDLLKQAIIDSSKMILYPIEN